jgi:DNA-directed RNA polymerase subunit beta'
MVIPDSKWTIVNEVKDQVAGFEQQYLDGLNHQGEKYNKVVDAWSKCNDKVTEAMMSTISASKTDGNGAEAEPNSVYMMAHSGARGSVTQMKQLGGMRGLMSKPSGEIIETPIISNFKEGLTVLEYFNSTHGARKGLSDTALKTANSGYLTRRLVDVAQDCIIRVRDCGTENAITAVAAVNDGEVISPLGERVLGRVAAEDIVLPGSDEVVVAKGEMIDERRADMLNSSGIASVRIRSPLTCEADEGVCAQCYGRDLARGTQVNIGEAVGIIAAQSIGEPGTQLTMRTFHIGGVAQGGQQSFLEASQEGKVEFRNPNVLTNAAGEQIVIGRNMSIAIVDDAGQERAAHKLSYGAKLHVKDGQSVKRGVKLFEWDPFTLPIIAEKAGVARFKDLISGLSVREDTDDATGMTQKIVSDWRSLPQGQRTEARDHPDGRRHGRSGPQRQRQPDQLSDVGGRHPFRRGRAGAASGRRGGAYPARRRQDQGHHRGSSPRGGTVRGPSSEGSRDHRGGRRLCPLRQGLQEQAPHHRGACRRDLAADGIHDPERASIFRCRKATSCRRATTSWTATRLRTTSCGSWGSRRLPTT